MFFIMFIWTPKNKRFIVSKYSKNYVANLVHNSVESNHFRLRQLLFVFSTGLLGVPVLEPLTEAKATMKRTLLASLEPRLDMETLVHLNLPDSFTAGQDQSKHTTV